MVLLNYWIWANFRCKTVTETPAYWFKCRTYWTSEPESRALSTIPRRFPRCTIHCTVRKARHISWIYCCVDKELLADSTYYNIAAASSCVNPRSRRLLIKNLQPLAKDADVWCEWAHDHREHMSCAHIACLYSVVVVLTPRQLGARLVLITAMSPEIRSRMQLQQSHARGLCPSYSSLKRYQWQP